MNVEEKKENSNQDIKEKKKTKNKEKKKKHAKRMDVEEKKENSDQNAKEEKKIKNKRKRIIQEGKKKNKMLFGMLEEWGLAQYANTLIVENGFDDISDWQDITEKDLLSMQFLLGHARKFLRKAKQYFDSKKDQSQIEGMNDNEQNNENTIEETYI